MNLDHKKTALRMIPYGLYVLTSQAEDGRIAAATVNWATQTSFEPPLVVVGVKADSGAHSIIKESAKFTLNILGKEQQATAFSFFKAAELKDNTINGIAFRNGSNGSPILEDVPAFLECDLVDTIERGDHSVFMGQVVDAGLSSDLEGRPDNHTLTLKHLGDKVFYGG